MTERLPVCIETHHLPFDIDRHLFDSVFESTVFTHWQLQDHTWQLRCVGDPGSGKTTFSALTVRHLRQKFQDSDNAIASIFLQSGAELEAPLLMQILESLFCQFSLHHTAADDLGNSSYRAYRAACENGQKPSSCIKLLRKALYARLSVLKRTFLVLDHCGVAANLLLEEELSSLQQHGLSIMVTSRVPITLDSDYDIECDAETHFEGIDRQLELFWICPDCEDKMYICSECREKEHVWKKCGHTSVLVEPYHHITLVIKACIPRLRKFLASALEKEHGDLGLHSTRSPSSLPPLSALGLALNHHPASVIKKFVNDLASTAENIAIARILLDLVHTAEPPTLEGACDAVCIGSVTNKIYDRIPRPIISLFNSAVTAIASRQGDGFLTLRALAAVARRRFTEGTVFPFQELAKQMCEEADGEDEQRAAASISITQLLRASRGFLVLSSYQGLAVYHLWLGIYFRDNYDERVFWKVEQQRRAGTRAFQFGPLRKSSTFAVVGKQEMDVAGAAGVALRPGLRKRLTALTSLGEDAEASAPKIGRRDERKQSREERNPKFALGNALDCYIANRKNRNSLQEGQLMITHFGGKH